MGVGRGRASLFLVGLAVGLSVLAGCSSTPHPTPSASQASPRPSPSATPAPTTITVLAPLGVNFRTGPSTTAPAVGALAQGVALPYLGHTAADGGWWEVQGSSQKGWITADPQYTSTSTFQTFSSASAAGAAWTVMYPEGWTFAQTSSTLVKFTDTAGSTIAFTTANTTAQLPPAASAGQAQSGVATVEVYGITAPLVSYQSTTNYQASVECQLAPSVALLVQAQLPIRGGAATLRLFLETVNL